MRRFASALLTLAFAGAASQALAQAQTLKVNYDISLAGLSIGKVDLSSTFTGPKYEIQGDVKLSGLAKMITGGKGSGTATGTIAGAQPQSSTFAVTSKSSGEQRTVRMSIVSGNVSAAEIDPPLEPKADRVPVKEADKKGIVDPISAILMPAVPSKDLTDPANCNRTLPVFDGASRLNVVLAYAETKSIEVPGYSGPVLVCNARYVPISGHRAERPATKFMQDNKDMAVWLAPVEGQRLLFPIRVSVRTMLGMGELEASNWSVEGAPKVTPTSGRRPARADQPIKAGAGQ